MKLEVVKGHGTENDFIVVPDLDGQLLLDTELVRRLCDRHSGLGADGVLRVVRSDRHPEAASMAAEAPYFMDYRNADGSIAEMCGNGVRVFVRYLQRVGLVEHSAAVATRGGVKRARLHDDDTIDVDMGAPRALADRPVVTAVFSDRDRPPRHVEAMALQIPNPHVVVILDSTVELAALDLSRAPDVAPSLPHGQNVEFVVRTGPCAVRMRVHERGVGETRSCGTGICAAVIAVVERDRAAATGISDPEGESWTVEVPGGRCQVSWRSDGADRNIHLRGPAVLVGEVTLDEAWLSS
ncbi:MAG: diaminopimelate epimerase [Actinobacteria bacterium]|nr:diaminopimelate epimerase [Actinomycetota bacterium]